MKIFIDGRTDLYGETIIQDWIQMINAEDGWESKFIDYDINCVFLEKNYRVIDELTNKSWRILYADKSAIILVKPE